MSTSDAFKAVRKIISWHQVMTDHKGQKEHCKYALIVYKGVFVDGLNDRFKGDLGGQSVTVLNHRLPIWTVPTVHCNTKRSHKQGSKKQNVIFFTTTDTLMSSGFSHPPHSGSRPAGPTHTCPSWSGTATGLQSDRCCGTRLWNSYTEAGPCLDWSRCAEGWTHHRLGSACSW